MDKKINSEDWVLIVFLIMSGIVGIVCMIVDGGQ